LKSLIYSNANLSRIKRNQDIDIKPTSAKVAH